VEQFVDTLVAYHPISDEAFRAEVGAAVELLYEVDHFHYFFTDRDGTLKSYSCSYPASIQPAYSGVIQAQFARRCAQTCVILTTAPLMHIGVLDVSTLPEGFYYYGASAGREWFIDPANKFKDGTIADSDLNLLDQVFFKISELLERKEFKNFTWVGSGLQKHFGHVTIGHQDIYKSVAAPLGEQLYSEIVQIVNELDPSERTLSMKRTETDIKIFIKAPESGKIFNKGHGIGLLVERMHCDLTDGNILVCGDSETDLPMLEVCLQANPLHVYTIWVTRDEALQRRVRELCASHGNAKTAFVSSPEVLLGAMAQATIREIQICRPPRLLSHE